MALPHALNDRQRLSHIEDTQDGGVNRRVQVMNSPSQPIPVSIGLIQTPLVLNVSVPLGNTEISQAIPDDTKSILIKCRGTAVTRIAFAPGETATNYVTLYPGASYKQEGLLTSGLTIYLRTSLASQVVEVLTWS